MSERGYRIKQVVRDMDQLERDIQAWQDQKQEFDARRSKIQASCPHFFERIGDPSGNNDSYDRCDLCGQVE